jgi:acetyl-CoA synthetase
MTAPPGTGNVGLPAWFMPDRWIPPPDKRELWRIRRLLEREKIASYGEFLSMSVDDPEWFYSTVFDDLGLEWPEPYRRLYDDALGRPFRRWFIGGRTNLVHLAVERWCRDGYGDRTALIWDEDGTTTRFTFTELSEQVSRIGAGLRSVGVGVGDVVALYMPMVPEAVVALLATARIGAVAAPAFSGYGEEPLVERLEISGAKNAHLLRQSHASWAADRHRWHRHARSRRRQHPATRGRCADGRRATAGQRAELGPAVLRRQRQFAGGVRRRAPVPARLYVGCDQPAEGMCPHARPAAVSAADRVGVRIRRQPRRCVDVGHGHGLDHGAAVGHRARSCSAAFVCIEGVPDHPTPDRLWSLVERHRVTHLGVSPMLVRMLAAKGEEWVRPWTFESLRTIGSTGEPMTPDAWRWQHRHVGRGERPIINISGGTEVGCGLVVGSPIVPTLECRFSGFTPGIQVESFDVAGNSVVGEPGELVVAEPWPSMTFGFWREPGRYLETYWSRWPAVWVHGDCVIRHGDGSWELTGRADDVLKIAGKRIRPAEIEGVALELPSVAAAAAVGLADPLKGQGLVVAVQLATEAADDVAALAGVVSTRLAERLGRSFRPAHTIVVPALPLTRSGKVHRRILRGWLAGEDAGDLSNLDNPDIAGAVVSAAVEQGMTVTARQVLP